MEFTARQIAELLEGTVEGNPEARVSRLAKIEEATEGSLTFLANPAYTQHLYTSSPTIAIVNKDFRPEQDIHKITLVKVPDAYKAFARLLEVYNQIVRDKKGIEEPSHISSTAKTGKDLYLGSFSYLGNNVVVGDNVKIYPHVYIGDNVSIGDNTTIYSGVKIYSDCVVGSDCTLHAGIVIGGDGFGFTPQDGSYRKVPQIGNVVIEDHVEIGSNTTIDRATLGSTVIRKGVKLDNLIQIAHNVEIGENTVIAAQTGVAGSTRIGKNCMVGGQVGIVGHITIANDVKIAAQSGIGASITSAGEIVQGSPGFNIGEFKRSYVLFRNLPELNQKIEDLEKKIKN